MRPMRKKSSEYKLGDMLIQYYQSEHGQTELCIAPYELRDKIIENKECSTDSLVQIKIEGDAAPFGFGNGHTMRNSASVSEFCFKDQRFDENGDSCVIRTILENRRGQRLEHTLTYHKGYPGLKIKTRITNQNEKETALEMLSSFSLGGITPFSREEGTDMLLLHRIRSKWSNEGRKETRTIEELQLEPSWSRWGVQSEKFGQIGSMPVRKYFPFAAIEDKDNQVIWAAQIACPSSWQMEVYRRDQALCFSGGLPDYDFGHWMKKISCDEYFDTPEVYLTVCRGTLDDACQRLTRMQERACRFDKTKGLPVLFNEFCTTWGNPSFESICRIVDIISDKDIDYFIIDAGWYADRDQGWENNMGDWDVSSELYPMGMQAAVDKIREAGLKPGIWFEPEIVGKDAQVSKKQDHLLKKHGKVIRAGNRMFWDMRDPWTQEYLADKVIGMLKKYGFEYIKVDYNESIGVGCDGCESLGQGLYKQMLAAQDFLGRIRREIPGILIEICSSGGHRLEPSMMEIGNMASFSDAHEEKEIPIIAANLHRTILPMQSQIWAVIRKNDSNKRIVYSLAATFLGVMCLSGDVFDCSRPQWDLIEEGIQFYRMISPIITQGYSCIYGTEQQSYRCPRGWQGVIRYAGNEEHAVAIIHTFAIRNPVEIALPLKNDYYIQNVFAAGSYSIDTGDKHLKIMVEEGFQAIAVLLAAQCETGNI
jgi:alpha-galactosidase